jgi:hypothetical protein
MVQSQPWQIVCKTLSQKHPTQKNTQHKKTYLKKPNHSAVAQVVEHLPSKCETLSSNHCTAKKKEKKRKSKGL